jgi:hypothetical protein
MLSILFQPYPCGIRELPRIVRTSIATGLFVFGFLYFFQPFGAGNWQDPNKALYLFGFGCVTTILLAAVMYGFPRLLPRWFAERHWTVGKEIIWQLLIIVCIALGNFLYSTWAFGGIEIGFTGLLNWVGVTAAVGVFPATVISLGNYTYQLRKYTREQYGVEPPTEAEQIAEAATELVLVAENDKDRLILPAADLLYVESADNYSEIVFRRGDKLHKELIRGSLSRLEAQLTVDFIVRCHRSYIVNLHQVSSVSGNAQGYKLHLQGLTEPIPVARKYAETVVLRHFKRV